MPTLTTDQPRTVIGTLTTTFTQPTQCTQAIQAANGYDLSAVAIRAQVCTTTVPYISDTGNYFIDEISCWPPAAYGTTAILPLLGRGFYSPGLICPVGHVTACSATGGGATGYSAQFSINNFETAIGCCPSGFQCSDQFGAQTCVSTATTGQSFAQATCNSGSIVDPKTITLPFTTTVDTQPNSEGGLQTQDFQSYSIFAPMIEIRHQASDIPPGQITSAPSTTPTSGSASSSSTSSPSSSGLSTSAKIAIGVVVPVVVILAALLAFFLLWRRRRARQSAASPITHDAKDIAGPPSDSSPGANGYAELPQPIPTELDNSAARLEMSAVRDPQEMAATSKLGSGPYELSSGNP